MWLLIMCRHKFEINKRSFNDAISDIYDLLSKLLHMSEQNEHSDKIVYLILHRQSVANLIYNDGFTAYNTFLANAEKLNTNNSRIAENIVWFFTSLKELKEKYIDCTGRINEALDNFSARKK